jgi:crotonobetainyl-CoA:carnitine CoA-transferase CaiB-like acyl-CoA transferase
MIGADLGATLPEVREKAAGPLRGLRVLEVGSIGPGPYCGMLLADLGAEVVRVKRPGGNGWPNAIVDRGRHLLHVDLTQHEGRTLCRTVADKVDVVMEGFRPGVMEHMAALWEREKSGKGQVIDAAIRVSPESVRPIDLAGTVRGPVEDHCAQNNGAVV